MTLQTKGVVELTEADVRTLFDNQVQEGKSLDYKQELPGASDSAREEFLFDVSSFANASGGHLVYGVEEQGGIPTQVCGLSVDDPDAEMRRLQSMILDGIDPRIAGLEVRFVPIANSKHVLVIHVPKSWNPPHMVTLQGVNKFCTRNSAGKHPLDVAELRTLFAMSSSVTEQIRKFRAERISRIVSDETPIPIPSGSKIVLHLLPLQAFSSPTRIDLSKAHEDLRLWPLGAQGYSKRINLDGLLNYTAGSFGRSGSAGYLQLYHNGIIETVDTTILILNARPSVNAPHLIPSTIFEREIIQRIQAYLASLQQLGISPPVVATLTLVGVKGFSMAVNPSSMGGGAPIDRDIVNVPEMLFQKLNCGPSDLKPMLDSVWNAAGWQQSPNFDGQGNHLPR